MHICTLGWWVYFLKVFKEPMKFIAQAFPLTFTYLMWYIIEDGKSLETKLSYKFES